MPANSEDPRRKPTDRIDRTRLDNIGERSASLEAKVQMLNDDVRELFRIVSDVKDSGNNTDNGQDQRLSAIENRLTDLIGNLEKKAATNRRWFIAIICAIIAGGFSILTTFIALIFG